MSKHILNSPKSLVVDALEGVALLNPATTLDRETTTLLRREINNEQCHIISGGGAGHEPAHAGFVGSGMLTAAVSGQVFASPNSRQVERVIQRLAPTKGTLIVVKNYTGDVLQFGLAKERWSATHPNDDKVRIVVVGDDVAVPRSQGILTGRRGLAGTVLVYKAAGAMAASGAPLDEVEHVAKIIAERCATIGVGLDHCQVPGTSKGEAYLNDDEFEIGMGVRKASPIPTASRLVDELLTTITDKTDKERGYLQFKMDGSDEVVLLINNLGGLPEIELAVLLKEACTWLKNKKITVYRAISGTVVSSLSLPGFSITLVLLPTEAVQPTSFTSDHDFDKDLLLHLLDAPTEAPGWRWHAKVKPEAQFEDEDSHKLKSKAGKSTESTVQGPTLPDSKLFVECIEAAIKNIDYSEPEITRFDTVAGDGDAGLTLKAGAEGLQERLAELSSNSLVESLNTIAEVADVKMGGTSGGLYSIFFSGLAKGLIQAQEELKEDRATPALWARGLEHALNTLYRYTRARPPSRTLVDPLSSFIVTFAANPSKIDDAFRSAFEAADATRSLQAKAGRAAYVDAEKIASADVPDAGAIGVQVILEGIRDVLTRSESKERQSS
ncbi:dihydroxyacetone kinase Dak1 [Meredithblackwellia eburnea MCA 4105]